MKRFIAAIVLIIFLVSQVGASMFSEEHANHAVTFFENLRHTKGEFHGQSFKLLPWELKIVRDVYGTLREDGTRQYRFVYIEVPKKNGKSELGAAAALYHLYGDGEWEGEVYGCAGNRKQAAIVFDVAKEMAKQSPALVKRSKFLGSDSGGTKIIRDLKTNSKYEVLSAEAFSKHGYSVSCCIFDELHAQPNRALWDVMTKYSGSGRKQPINWVITTAGDDPDRETIGWEIHEYAMQILSGEKIDPRWYVVIYGYDGDDIYNEENWKIANPGLGYNLSIEDMRGDALQAKNLPADERAFRWLRLNQWITTKLTSWLPLDLWDTTVGTWTRDDLKGKTCYVGMDLSSTTDLTALCAVFPPQGTQLDWRVIWDTFIPEENMRDRVAKDHVDYDKWLKDGWITATPGNVVDYTTVKARILEWKSIYKIRELPSDRAFASMLIQELEREGIVCTDCPQTFAVLTDPMNTIDMLLKSGKMTHENNLTARWAFGNTSIAKNGNAQIKYVKEHKGKSVVRTKRIDPTAAWVIAMSRARFHAEPVDLSARVLSDDWGM